ncbi:IS30 family transposase, partial [Pseudoxanthomonas broegbernensis]
MRTYNEVTLNERVEIQQRRASGDSLRAIGRSLGRAPSTISRECRRASASPDSYQAQA